jgi:hypothetical protein
MAPTADDLAGPPAPPHPPRPPPPPPPSRAPAETPTPTNHAAAISSPLGVAAAASALAVVGLALPAAAVALSPCRGGAAACGDFEVEVFEVCVLLSQAAAAAVALACVSRKVAVHGLRRFLFVDPDLGMRIRFQKEYVARIQVKVPPHSCFRFI